MTEKGTNKVRKPTEQELDLLVEQVLGEIDELKEEKIQKEKDARIDVSVIEKANAQVDKKVIAMLHILEKTLKEKFTKEEFNFFYKNLDRQEREMQRNVEYNEKCKMYVINERMTRELSSVIFVRYATVQRALVVLFKRSLENASKKESIFSKFKKSSEKDQKVQKDSSKSSLVKIKNNQQSGKQSEKSSTDKNGVKKYFGKKNGNSERTQN